MLCYNSQIIIIITLPHFIFRMCLTSDIQNMIVDCVIYINVTRMHSSRMCTTRSSSRLVGGGAASVHAGIHPLGPGTPWVWAWTSPHPDPQPPPWVWAWIPPPDPPTSLLGLGLDTQPCPDPPTFPLDLGLDIPPVDRMTDRCKNTTFANFVCRRL